MLKRYKKNEFCFDIPFQRDVDYWKRPTKSLLIDSILNGYKIPSLWICITPTKTYPANSVIDGIQRMTTIIQFVNNEFKLSNDIKPITLTPGDYPGIDKEETYKIAGKTFSELPEVLQDMILYADLDLQELYNYTDDEIEEQFFRLNNGVALTSSQKLKVLLDATVAEKIKGLTELPFWTRTNFSTVKIRNGELYATVLQCLMFVTGYAYNEDHRVKTFSSKEMSKFAVYYSENYNGNEMKYLKELITTLDDVMMTSDENQAYLNKTNIPPLIANVDKFLSLRDNGELRDDDYTEFLNEWVSQNAEVSGYNSLGKAHTTGGSVVAARVDLLDEWLDKYVNSKKQDYANSYSVKIKPDAIDETKTVVMSA